MSKELDECSHILFFANSQFSVRQVKDSYSEYTKEHTAEEECIVTDIHHDPIGEETVNRSHNDEKESQDSKSAVCLTYNATLTYMIQFIKWEVIVMVKCFVKLMRMLMCHDNFYKGNE